MALPKLIKAGGGERGQYILHEHNDNTVRFVLYYPGLVQVDLLRAAVRAIVESVDVLHGTFFTDGLGAYWKLNEAVDECHYFLYVQTAGDPAPTAGSLALQPVYSAEKAQLHCTLVQSGCASALVVRMSHLVVDGGDGKYLLEKLVEAYNLLAQGGSLDGFTIKNGSRAPEKLYESISKADMKKLMSSSPSSTEVRSFYPFPTDDPGRSQLVSAVIPAGTLSAARKKAKAAGASANDLILAAAYRAYAALDAVDAAAPMSITSTMDLRRHCKNGESEGLCNMSGSFLTLLQDGCTGGFSETLAAVAAQTRKIKENPLAGLEGMPIVHALARYMPIGILTQAMNKIYGGAPVGVTNLGNLNCADFALAGLRPTGGLCGGPIKKKPGMQISVISFDGECVLSVMAQCTAKDAAMLQDTLNKMAQEIAGYAAP